MFEPSESWPSGVAEISEVVPVARSDSKRLWGTPPKLDDWAALVSGGLFVRSMALLVKYSDPLLELKIRPPLFALGSRPPVVTEASEVVPVWRSRTKTLDGPVWPYEREAETEPRAAEPEP